MKQAPILILSAALLWPVAGMAEEGQRDRYAELLKSELLKRGHDVRISAQPPRNELLLIMGPTAGRVLIFNLISYANLIETAHKLGFKTIEIINSFPGGDRWTFDLSKPGPVPRCSTTGPVVCRAPNP